MEITNHSNFTRTCDRLRCNPCAHCTGQNASVVNLFQTQNTNFTLQLDCLVTFFFLHKNTETLKQCAVFLKLLLCQ